VPARHAKLVAADAVVPPTARDAEALLNGARKLGAAKQRLLLLFLSTTATVLVAARQQQRLAGEGKEQRRNRQRQTPQQPQEQLLGGERHALVDDVAEPLQCFHAQTGIGGKHSRAGVVECGGQTDAGQSGVALPRGPVQGEGQAEGDTKGFPKEGRLVEGHAKAFEIEIVADGLQPFVGMSSCCAVLFAFLSAFARRHSCRLNGSQPGSLSCRVRQERRCWLLFPSSTSLLWLPTVDPAVRTAARDGNLPVSHPFHLIVWIFTIGQCIVRGRGAGFSGVAQGPALVRPAIRVRVAAGFRFDNLHQCRRGGGGG